MYTYNICFIRVARKSSETKKNWISICGISITFNSVCYMWN